MKLQPLLYSHREAAKLLSVSERTLYSMRVGGKIAAVKIGNTGWRYSIQALERFIQESEEIEKWRQSQMTVTADEESSSLTARESEKRFDSAR